MTTKIIEKLIHGVKLVKESGMLFPDQKHFCLFWSGRNEKGVELEREKTFGSQKEAHKGLKEFTSSLPSLNSELREKAA